MKRPKKIPLRKFDYKLPIDLISQTSIKPRDHARLLILDKSTGQIEHKKFFNIEDYLKPGDVLVLNNSKVIPARLLGHKEIIYSPPSLGGVRGGGQIEIFLLTKKFPSLPRRGLGVVADNFDQPLFNLPLKRGENNNVWQVMIKGLVKINQNILLKNKITTKIIKRFDEQSWLVKFNCSDKKLFAIGDTPLPPYIKKRSKLEDYQTVYAKSAGSVAAPTAGLHFTKNLISKLKKNGIKIEYITLHVGLGTFLPVKSNYIQDHKIHSELAILDKKTAKTINQAKKSGHQIIAVGTTSLRTLEAFAKTKFPPFEACLPVGRGGIQGGLIPVIPQTKWVDIFIYPGYKFKIVDQLITNFHLPKSTLLMLVCALAGEKNIKRAYQMAIAKKYKFFSFGDAMFIK